MASARRPSRTRSSIPESRAARQSGPSVGRPCATELGPRLGEQLERGCRTPARARSASRSRSHAARAGLCPPVETVTSSAAPVAAGPAACSEQRSGSSARVDPDPGRLAVVEHRLVDRRVVGARRPRAGSPATSPARVGPLLPGDVERAAPRRTTSVATTCTIGAGLEQAARLLGRHRAATDDQHPPARRRSRLTGYERVVDGHRLAAQSASGDRRAAGLALLVEAEDLQLDGEVDLAQRDARRAPRSPPARS